MVSLNDNVTALRTRDAIEAIVRKVVQQTRPAYRYGAVTAINRATNTCDVLFPGDSTSVTVYMGSIQPTAVGQTVRVDGVDGDKFVSDVIGAAVPTGYSAEYLTAPTLQVWGDQGSVLSKWTTVEGAAKYQLQIGYDNYNLLQDYVTATQTDTGTNLINSDGVTDYGTDLSGETLTDYICLNLFDSDWDGGAATNYLAGGTTATGQVIHQTGGFLQISHATTGTAASIRTTSSISGIFADYTNADEADRPVWFRFEVNPDTTTKTIAWSFGSPDTDPTTIGIWNTLAVTVVTAGDTDWAAGDISPSLFHRNRGATAADDGNGDLYRWERHGSTTGLIHRWSAVDIGGLELVDLDTVADSVTGETWTYRVDNLALVDPVSTSTIVDFIVYGDSHIASVLTNSYYVRVRAATEGDAYGPWSNVATVTPTSSAGSDGEAPSTSPSVVVKAGLGMLEIVWTPVTNKDIVNYEVHISDTNGFTAGPTTLLGDTTGSFWITTVDADGVALDYGTTYYVRIIAKDDDGAAPAGPISTGTPRQVDTGDAGSIAIDALSDGSVPPAVAAAPTMKTGIGFLMASWAHVTNDDPVTYEIHVSTVTPWTPVAGTKVGETPSNFAFIRKLGTNYAEAELTYGTTYYVKIFAKDADGYAADPSAEATTSTVKAGTTDIEDLSITNALIANLAVDEAQIASLAVTEAKIAALAVSSAKIQNLAVGEAQIASLAVATGKIQDLAVTTAKIDTLAVDTAQIANAAITSAKIENLAVGEAQIASAAITNAKIGALAVDTANIAAAAITDAKINDLSASKINTGTLNAGVVTVTNLNASNITTGNLSADRIDGGTISGTAININSGQFQVTSGGAVTAASLTMTGGSITGSSFNMGSGTFQVTTGGTLTATAATLTGGLKTAASSTYFDIGQTSASQLRAYQNSTLRGYLSAGSGGIYMRHGTSNVGFQVTYSPASPYIITGSNNVAFGNTRIAAAGHTDLELNASRLYSNSGACFGYYTLATSTNTVGFRQNSAGATLISGGGASDLTYFRTNGSTWMTGRYTTGNEIISALPALGGTNRDIIYLTSNGQWGYPSSSAAYKSGIEDRSPMEADLLDMKPRRFRYDKDKAPSHQPPDSVDEAEQVGFIVEELAAVDPKFVGMRHSVSEPRAVTPAQLPEDDPRYDPEDETTQIKLPGEGDLIPATVDRNAIVSHLVAHVQALTLEVEDLKRKANDAGWAVERPLRDLTP